MTDDGCVPTIMAVIATCGPRISEQKAWPQLMGHFCSNATHLTFYAHETIVVGLIFYLSTGVRAKAPEAGEFSRIFV